MWSAVAEIIEKHCVHAAAWQEETLFGNCRCQLVRQNSCVSFMPLHQFKGVESFWKIETGLKCDQPAFLRKLITTTDRPCWAWAQHEHSVSQFCRQPPTPLESSFNFLDRLDPYQLMQRQKTLPCHFAPQIGDDYFQGGSPLLMLCMSTVFLNFLYNYRPFLSPVSISRTNSIPLNLCKGQKHSAARIGYRDFQGRSSLLMLCMSIMILIYLDNSFFFVL
jgi:hypothetical protein